MNVAQQQRSVTHYELAGENDPAWRLILRWPGISAELQLAWRFLWVESSGARRLVNTTSEAVGLYRGRGGDAGREAMKGLAAGGLIVVKDRPRATGNRIANGWLVEVFDPVQLHHEMLRRIDDDAQLDLDFEQRTKSAGDGSPRPTNDGTSTPGTVDPRALGWVPPPAEHGHAPRGGTLHGPPAAGRHYDETLPAKSRFAPNPKRRDISLPKPNPTEEEEGLGLGGRERSRIFAGKVSSATPVRDAIAEALVRVADQSSPARRQEEIRNLLDGMRRRVNCPQFDSYDGRARFAAESIVDGVFPLRELETCYRYVEKHASQGTLQGPRSQCFNGALRGAMARYGLRLPTDKQS